MVGESSREDLALVLSRVCIAPERRSRRAGTHQDGHALGQHGPQTGDYSAVCPELPGCASAGETEEEARANIREAIELYLAPGDIELPENAKLVEVTVG